MSVTETIKTLAVIPGVGKSIAKDLYDIGIRRISDLKGKKAQQLYDASNQVAGCVQDRCLLYVFRCAIYFAETPPDRQHPDKLKWWHWKDPKTNQRMEKLDIILAVHNVEKSAEWYEQIFNFRRNGRHLAVLYSESNNIMLCLHPWEQDDHPSMRHRNLPAGNGLILYFKTDNLMRIRENALHAGARIDEDLHVNPRPRKKEFSLWDPDGYYWIVTEYHEYEG